MEQADGEKSLSIGPWQLLPDLNLLRRDGQELRLEPRYVDLLVYLAGRPGDVVSTDDILQQVWGGQIVGDHSVYQAIARLRKALGDEASVPRYIETVPKRGYRLIADVGRGRNDSATDEAGRRHRPWVIWTIAGLLLSTVALYLVLRPSVDGTAPPAIAVLPFTALSEHAEDSHIAQGFAIELADALGRIEQITVLGPVSSDMAADTRRDTSAIGQQLGADIVISGSLRRAGNTLRVSATMSDGADGEQLWSRISEHPDGDIFAAQREIADALSVAIRHRHGWPDAPPTPPEQHGIKAYDYYLLGRFHRTRREPASLQRAAEYFRAAIELEPEFGAARNALATTVLLSSFYDDLPLDAAIAQTTPLLQRSLAESPQDGDLLAAIGLSHYLQGSFGFAEDYLDRATASSDDDAEAWMWLGLARRQQGKLHSAADAFAQASTREPLMVTVALNHANALSWMGQAESGKALLRRVESANTDNPQLYRGLADIAIDQGKLADAYRWSGKAVALNPQSELSQASRAMVLAYVGRIDEAMQIAAALKSPSRATQRYLDRLGATSIGLAPPAAPDAPPPQAPSRANMQEIDWRQAHARYGLGRYLAGDADTAAIHLGKALEGRDYPIERTDYDLFLCTSLVDALRRLDAHDNAGRWLARCHSNFDEGLKNGWDTLAMRFVRARLSMLDGDPETALGQLQALPERGFRNHRLLLNDPLFTPLRGEHTFQQLLASIKERVDEDAIAVALIKD